MTALLLWKYGAVRLMPRRPGTSSLSQSSWGPGPPTNPVRSARPGSELVLRTLVPAGITPVGPCVGSDSVISYVRAFRTSRVGHGANAKRGGDVVSTGRGHWLEMFVN